MLYRISLSEMFRGFIAKLIQHPEYYPIKHYKRLRRK